MVANQSEEGQSSDRKYLFEYVLIKYILFVLSLFSAIGNYYV